MVKHGETLNTIIIPHRDRHRDLARCLRSITWSARAIGKPPPWEVVVVDSGSAPPAGAELEGWLRKEAGWPASWCRLSVITDPAPPALFNKCRVLNLGVERPSGEVLTFIDADAVVGPQWLAGIETLADPAITLLCYRVRYLEPGTELVERIAGPCRKRIIDRRAWRALFRPAEYSRHPRSYEAYGSPEHCPKLPPEISSPAGIPLERRGEVLVGAVLGNSQFSIRREVLGELRWDEGFVGRGWEDLDMTRRIWRHHGKAFCGALNTDSRYGMFVVKHAYRNDWRTAAAERANRRRYLAGGPT